MNFCTSCGSRIQPGEGICRTCGASVGGAANGNADAAAANVAASEGGNQANSSTGQSQVAATNESPPNGGNRAPWLWMLVGGGAVAVAGVGAFVLLGGSGDTASSTSSAIPAAPGEDTSTAGAGTDVTDSGGTSAPGSGGTSGPGSTITSKPPAPAPTANCATVGGMELRSENINGWQVCSSSSWSAEFAQSAAYSVSGPGHYESIYSPRTGNYYSFDCVSSGARMVTCSGGTIQYGGTLVLAERDTKHYSEAG